MRNYYQVLSALSAGTTSKRLTLTERCQLGFLAAGAAEAGKGARILLGAKAFRV